MAIWYKEYLKTLKEFMSSTAPKYLSGNVAASKPCGCIQAYYPGGPILYVPGCACERREAALEWCEVHNASRKRN